MAGLSAPKRPDHRQRGNARSRSGGGRRTGARPNAGRGPVRKVVGIFATLLAVAGATLVPALPAAAAPVYEITARWAEEPPATVASGDVLNAEWRVNVNDDAAAPSNEPVDNVNFTLTIENGVFEELPDSCLVDGVTPASSISEDGKTLVCNIGTQNQGTSHLLQTPIRVDGATGSQLTGTGAIEGATADLTPVDITNPFGMDIRWSVATSNWTLNNYPASPTVDMDLQWTLSRDNRSEPGPQTVTYDLNITSGAGSTISIGGQRCTPFTAGAANGHPWSGGDHPAEQTVSPVDTCTIQQLGPNSFRLTLTGIDYEPVNPPTRDSTGAALPADQVAVASGSIWLRVVPGSGASLTLQSSAPTYTAPSGETAQDDPANNSVTKTWTYPGAFTSPWVRGYTGSGGTNYDASYQVSPGTEIQQVLVTGYPGIDRADNLPVGLCTAVDTRYLTFAGVETTAASVPGAVIQYFVGNHASVDPANAAYDPQAFPCGIAGGWTTTAPADPSTVKAVRITMTQGQAEAIDGINAGWNVGYTVKQDVAAGQDIWNFGFHQAADGTWSGVPTTCSTPTPGLRYPCTVGALRDLVRIASTTPYIEKSADRSTVVPGTPATFSLTYSANVPSNLPESVDDYQIVDTLPAGVTYVAGSASPEPTVATNGSGQQVLTWNIDGVTTNRNHVLTYQAVADSSVEPGSTLTNSAVASVSGVTSLPARAQVTVSTNGYTAIGKTADMAYVPNVNGDGVGEGSWTVTLRSFDPLAQAFTDTIDILPFNGDERGTDFAGDYALTEVNAAAGATVYYTTADPASLSDDPADDSNGAAGDPTGNTVGWSTTFTPDATAVRVIGPELAPGATQQFQVVFATDGVEGGDRLVNRAQARDEHTELVMRTSAPITVANYYSASLKKYVLGKDGEWHDANDAVEYPSYRPGETVPYRIVIENTGQGTITDLEITDDLFPEGSFTVDELAPGEEQAHEFEMVLEEGGLDTVVNTACAAAAIPADSEIPPTINCDPAGIEVDGDPTHVKELVSATPIGNGQWEVVYGLDVTNSSTHATSYDLADTLHFTDEATIVSAEVTEAPDGITLATPAWNGQDATVIAGDVPLLGTDDAGYAPHRYEVTVVAEVPLQLPGAGTADDPTQCGPDGDDADRAFNNTSALTDEAGDVEEDQACAVIPSIDITKTVAGGPTPNGDGTWTVTYEIVATNTGAAAGEYEVRDRMTADGDLVVESGEVTSAPEGVTVSPAWTGLGAEGAPENVIASGITLPAGGTHTYEVEVVLSFDAADGVPVITPCDATGGGEAGGLSNAAEIEHNDLTDDAAACVTVTDITVDKTIASGPAENGDGTWTIVYEIVAENVGPEAGDYDVYDQLRFGEGITIEDTDVTGPAGVTLAGGWTGLGAAADAAENLIAEGVTLESGASHTYGVEVVVSLDEATIDPSDLACPPPGSGLSGALANGTLLDHNGIPAADEVCATLPLIEVDKSISDGPTANGDGTWTITYDLVATNTGAAEGVYDIADELRFGEGIVIESAEVITTPDGVTAGEAWNGQGENTIATDVALEAGGTHTYQVQVVVSLDLETVTPSDLACPPPGSGENGGLANTVELTHNGETQSDDDCAPLPLVDITKSLSGAVVPVEGEEGVYDATYEITVTNRGPASTVYDLDDRLAVGEGVTVVSVQDVTTDAPDSVGINPDFGTDGNTRIVTAQSIAAATGGPVVHTYSVTIRYALDLTAVDGPVADTCTTGDGGVADGALHNVAAVSWNGIPGEDDECVLPSKPTLDKQLVSAEPAGEGQWDVVYDLIVGNTGDEATTYDLDDEFLFARQVTVDTVTVTGPEGVEVDDAFDGAENQRIATDVEIAGLDDAGYAPHVYTVTVRVNVPVHFDEADADGTGAPGCTVPAGGNFLEQGLNNAATLTDETGGTQTDTDCAPLPSIDITKQIVGAPVQADDGEWSVTYEIVAVNDGGAAGDYQVVDRLRYGAGIEVTGARITEAPEGVTLAEGWTGLGEEGAAENVVADGILAAGGTHTYRVVVTSTLDTGAADASTLACPEPGSDAAGGFANTAGITHNGLADAAAACDVPEWPEDVPPPLASTGGAVSVGLLGGALLLLIAGGVLLVARRRTARG
ncbi:DUF11 domain-containing protein [Microbacterium sp. JZ31]|uniref:DUF11 domain-containing protein n=1 Tax=Microbacterium sp. JZ31 TaxID=1906274 RepID=UPI001932C061|nr:DUF11 domain-containing protein [Microbacterium sp. JZ31]